MSKGMPTNKIYKKVYTVSFFLAKTFVNLSQEKPLTFTKINFSIERTYIVNTTCTVHFRKIYYFIYINFNDYIIALN